MAHPYGSIGCDSPIRLVEAALDEAARLPIVFDFVLITGDFCRHGILANNETGSTPMQNVHTILYTVSQLLVHKFPNTTIVPVLGNNDIVPDYYLDIENKNNATAETLSIVAEGLSPLFQSREQQYNNFAKSGFFAVNVTDTLTVLSLNTILYATRHLPLQSALPADPFDQFAWLEQNLQQVARTRNTPHKQRKVYITGHIPPTIGSYRHTQLWKTVYLERYYAIVEKYSDVIAGQLFGHLHTDEFRVVHVQHDKSFPLLLTSSTSPIYGSNPSFRVVRYDDVDESGQLLDFDTYYLDLATTNMSNSSPSLWKKGPSFTESYRVADLSAASLRSIVSALLLTDNEDAASSSSLAWDALVTRQHIIYTGDASCAETCRREWACTLSSMTAEQYTTCLAARSQDSVFSSVYFVCAVVVAMMLLVSRHVLKRWLQRRSYTMPFSQVDSMDDHRGTELGRLPEIS